jgi:hypothetical protein
VPCADKNTQPKTSLPIWGNGKIQVLQHRAYGAERYMRLFVGWELEGFVLRGENVVEKHPNDSNLQTLLRMIECSFNEQEGQPLMILRKLGNDTFDDSSMYDWEWSIDKKEKIEREYESMKTELHNMIVYV